MTVWCSNAYFTTIAANLAIRLANLSLSKSPNHTARVNVSYSSALASSMASPLQIPMCTFYRKVVLIIFEFLFSN